MEALLEALSEVERLLKEGKRGSGVMGSEIHKAKRNLERAFGEFQRSY